MDRDDQALPPAPKRARTDGVVRFLPICSFLIVHEMLRQRIVRPHGIIAVAPPRDDDVVSPALLHGAGARGVWDRRPPPPAR